MKKKSEKPKVKSKESAPKGAKNPPDAPGHTQSIGVSRPIAEAKTAAAKKRMLIALADPRVFTVRAACELADVGFKTHYEWVEKDTEYAAEVLIAIEKQTQNLEQKMGERAVGIGVKVPSDYLATFLAQGRRPEVYRQQTKAEIKDKDGNVVSFTLNLGDRGTP